MQEQCEKIVQDTAGAEKPPLGVAPYYIPAEARIKELAQAIERYTDTGLTACIETWAREIIEQCKLIETLRRVQYDTDKGTA